MLRGAEATKATEAVRLRRVENIPDPVADGARVVVGVTNSLGERHRTCASATELISEKEWKDWPIRWPRIIGRVCRFINKKGGTPMGRHSKWKVEARLPFEPGVVEHEAVC